jgi:hypothetical protein
MNDPLKDQKSIKFDDGSAYELKTQGTPMVDSGTGRPLILEVFEYFINPIRVKELEERKIVISKQEIFDGHWPQIRALIWSKGLVASTDVEPRIVIGKRKYRIFILCEPKFRTVLKDKPQTLQQIFQKPLQTKK